MSIFQDRYIYIKDGRNSKEFQSARNDVRAGAHRLHVTGEDPVVFTYRVGIEGMNSGIERDFDGAEKRARQLLRSKPLGLDIRLERLRNGKEVGQVRFRRVQTFHAADTRGPEGLDRVEGFIETEFPKARFAGDCVCKPDSDHADCAAVDYFDTEANMVAMRERLSANAGFFHIKYIILFDRIYFFDTDGKFTSSSVYTGVFHSHIHVSVYGGIRGSLLSDVPEEPTFVRITNQMVYAELQATRADLRALSQTIDDYPETRKRVRALELKFYGVLAGAISAFAAIGVIVARGG